MFDTEVDFKSLVERIQTGERDYAARFSTKGTEDNYRELPSLFVRSIDEANRRIEAVVSDASIDRYDEIVLPEAFRDTLSDYLRNPVLISAHAHRLETGHSSVIGKTAKAFIDEEGLHCLLEFAETELGNEYWYLYKNKFQRAFSIGFRPVENKWEKITSGKSILVHTKIELIEISCVPVPANPNALSKSKQRKAAFIADKIAQRRSIKDEQFIEQLKQKAQHEPIDDEQLIEELKQAGEWPTEEECLEFAELVSENNEDEAALGFEPDYGGIVTRQSSSDFYSE